MGSLRVKRTKCQNGRPKSGTQKAQEDHEQQDRRTLQNNPPLHKLVGVTWIPVPHHADHAGDQYTERRKQEDAY